MQTSSNAGGFSLIEVLVAVLVLAVGMLGIAAMQAVSLRNSQSSFERTQAVMESYSILDAVRARGGGNSGAYNAPTLMCEPPEAGVSGAQDDLRAWIESLKENINATACGRVNCDGLTCLVEVQWNDSRGSGDEDELQEYLVQTRTSL